MLITNVELPLFYSQLFEQHNISVKIVPFDKYKVLSTFKWRLAFYKLQALDWVVSNTDFDNYLGVDTDTYFISSLDQLWEECNYNLPILFPQSNNTTNNTRKAIIEDYTNLFNCHYPIVHYGGEFIAGSKNALTLLVDNLMNVYNVVEKSNFNIWQDSGDEAFLSMAAHGLKIHSGSSFVFRFWTRRYYSISYNYFNIPIWHLPGEKLYGLMKMYNLLSKSKNVSSKKAARIFNFTKPHPYSVNMIKYYLFMLYMRLFNK